MSYTIYKTIKQNDDASFDICAAESNVTDYNGRRQFTNSTINYFNKQYPELNPIEKKYMFVIMGLHAGDVYYQSNWKDLQKHINNFLKSNHLDAGDLIMDSNKRANILNDIHTYLHQQPKEATKSYKVKIVSKNEYIGSVKNHHIYLSSEEDAKIFKTKLSKLQERLSGYNKYGLVYEEVKENINGNTNCN